MKKMLLVLGLVAICSLAASAKTPSTTYNFYFLTTNGDPYCDGMFLNNYGSPQTLIDGTHFDSWCLLENGLGEINLSVAGFLAPVASNYQYGGSGNVMIVADESVAFDGPCGPPSFLSGLLPIGHGTGTYVTCPASSGAYPTDVYLINPVTNTWTLWMSGGGAGEFVVNYGTLQPAVGPFRAAKPSPSSSPSFAR